MSARQPHELLLAAQQSTPAIGALIPIGASTIGTTIVQTTDARGLHAFLKVGKDFSSWIKARIEQYSFAENVDFVVIDAAPQNGGAGNRGARVEYALTLGMAKELAMVERNAKGKEARQYFIECERRALAGPALPNFADPAAAARAWADEVEAKRALASKAAQLEHQVADQAPAVAGLKLIADASGSMCFRDAAATLNMPQHALTDYLVSKGWIYERAGAEGYKAYRARLQALDLRYNTFGYESKTTGERKARQQVRITNKGLTRLAEMIAAEAAERKLAAATPQHQHRLGLDPS